MGTSDIALERIQALLKVDVGGGSLYSHTARLAESLAADKQADALSRLEAISCQLKLSSCRGPTGPDAVEEAVQDAVADEKQLKWCKDALQLVRPPSDPTAAPKVLGAVQNFLEDAQMFEWAGVGFGKQESFRIAMSLRKLAADVPSLERLRLWGKILGTGGDYYVAEGALQAIEVEPGEPPLPGTPAYDVEPQGLGANTYAYWVTEGGCEPWVRLPAARASHIVAARQTKRLFTGQLGSEVLSMPWFPGKERHLLRAQIARISSTCTLAVKGYYEIDEEAEGNPHKLKEVEDVAEVFPSHEDLAGQAGWMHCSPYLLATGKSTWPDLEALEEKLSEEVLKDLQAQQEAEPAHEPLEGIEADLEELKPEDAEESPAWSIRVYGDQGLYTFPDKEKSHRVTAVRSLIWPGAVTVSQGTRFANLYVGYGMKCGTLVPPAPDSGLPLRGTSPFLPLVPDDIMDEPKDLEEQEEPNPQHDEAESDKEEMDEEEEEDG